MGWMGRAGGGRKCLAKNKTYWGYCQVLKPGPGGTW